MKYDMDATYSLHLAESEWSEDWDQDEAKWEWGKEDNIIISNSICSIDYESKKNGWFNYDMTESLKKSLNGEIDNHGFVLKCSVNGTLQMSGNQSGFYSSEYDNVELRPKLTIVYSNEPVANVNKERVIDKKPSVYLKNKKTLHFNTPIDGEYVIRVLTINGKEIINIKTSSSAGINKIDLSGKRTLSKSTYIVEIKGVELIIRESLIIQ